MLEDIGDTLGADFSDNDGFQLSWSLEEHKLKLEYNLMKSQIFSC